MAGSPHKRLRPHFGNKKKINGRKKKCVKEESVFWEKTCFSSLCFGLSELLVICRKAI
jgi:hypothetical protein